MTQKDENGTIELPVKFCIVRKQNLLKEIVQLQYGILYWAGSLIELLFVVLAPRAASGPRRTTNSSIRGGLDIRGDLTLASGSALSLTFTNQKAHPSTRIDERITMVLEF